MGRQDGSLRRSSGLNMSRQHSLAAHFVVRLEKNSILPWAEKTTDRKQEMAWQLSSKNSKIFWGMGNELTHSKWRGEDHILFAFKGQDTGNCVCERI